MANPCRIAQVNIHHARAASAVMTRMFVKQRLGIALLQEPWFYRDQIRGLSGKGIKVIWTRGEETPRACIMLKDSINHICLSDHSTRDLVAIQTPITIGATHREIVIASAYFAGDGNQIPPREVQRLVEYCRKRKIPLLIGCDDFWWRKIWKFLM